MAHSSNAAAQLLAPLVSLKGVGEHLSAKLARLDLYTIEDLLYQLPVRYEDRRHLLSIAQLRPGESAPFRAQILSAAEVKTGGRRSRTVFEVLVGDDSGQIVLKWFHYRRAWMERSYRPGREILAFGEVRMFGTQREILHPEVEFDPAAQQGAAILPVYPLTEGISQKRMRSIIQAAAIDYSSFLHSDISVSLRDKRNLIEVEKRCYISIIPPSTPISKLCRSAPQRHIAALFTPIFFICNWGSPCDSAASTNSMGVRLQCPIAIPSR